MAIDVNVHRTPTTYVTYHIEEGTDVAVGSGDKVVLLFLGGDPQRPVILGKLAEDTISEATDIAGHIFQNVPYLEGLEFQSGDRAHIIFLDGDPNKPVIVQNVDYTKQVEVQIPFRTVTLKAYPPKNVEVGSNDNVVIDFPEGDVNHPVIVTILPMLLGKVTVDKIYVYDSAAGEICGMLGMTDLNQIIPYTWENGYSDVIADENYMFTYTRQGYYEIWDLKNLGGAPSWGWGRLVSAGFTGYTVGMARQGNYLFLIGGVTNESVVLRRVDLEDFSYQEFVFGYYTNARAITSDGSFIYIATSYKAAYGSLAIVIKVDPNTGDEVGGWQGWGGAQPVGTVKCSGGYAFFTWGGKLTKILTSNMSEVDTIVLNHITGFPQNTMVILGDYLYTIERAGTLQKDRYLHKIALSNLSDSSIYLGQHAHAIGSDGIYLYTIITESPYDRMLKISSAPLQVIYSTDLKFRIYADFCYAIWCFSSPIIITTAEPQPNHIIPSDYWQDVLLGYVHSRDTYWKHSRWWIFIHERVTDSEYAWALYSAKMGGSWTRTFVRTDNIWEGDFEEISASSFDGSYFHYAIVDDYVGEIYYRRGELQANGDIIWSADEQVISCPSDYGIEGLANPRMCVDSSGYPYISAVGYKIGADDYMVTMKSSTNDGTFYIAWTDYESAGANVWIGSCLTPFEDGVYLLWQDYDTAGWRGKYLPGGSAETITNLPTMNEWSFALLDVGDELFLALQEEYALYQYRYKIYRRSGGYWSLEKTFSDFTNGYNCDSALFLSKNQANQIYLLIQMTGTFEYANQSVISKRSNGEWTDPPPLLFADKWGAFTAFSCGCRIMPDQIACYAGTAWLHGPAFTGAALRAFRINYL